MNVVLPAGIGDILWAFLKIQSLGNGPFDIILATDPAYDVNHRAISFAERFDFVRSVKVENIPITAQPFTDERGRINYVADGWRDGMFFMIPNRTLEDGRRIETWLPELPINWDVMSHFSWEGFLWEPSRPYVAFYLGPESGNVDRGHNRNWLWNTEHWLDLGQAMNDCGLDVVVVGAKWDLSFWTRYMEPNVKRRKQCWYSTIGQTDIAQCLNITKKAQVFVGFQSGLTVATHYLGGRCACWWRPEGDSIDSLSYMSFDEKMKDAWVRPGWESHYIGLVYTRQTPAQIIAEMNARRWLPS